MPHGRLTDILSTLRPRVRNAVEIGFESDTTVINKYSRVDSFSVSYHILAREQSDCKRSSHDRGACSNASTRHAWRKQVACIARFDAHGNSVTL
jgi:hypothetical protein